MTKSTRWDIPNLPTTTRVKLDKLTSHEGILDPLALARQAEQETSGLDDAAENLAYILGCEINKIRPALAYGLSCGAHSSGEALARAERDHQIDPEVARTIRNLAETNPMFNLIVSYDTSRA